MRSWLRLFLLGGLLTNPGLQAQDTTPLEEPPSTALAGITARELGAHMRFLASDLMRGRDTASEEIRIASEYLATRLEAAGANPAGSRDTYFQEFPLELVTPSVEGTELDLILERNGSTRVIPARLGVDFGLFPRGLDPGEIEAPVVFAGYGIVDEEAGVDDYAGLDVKDRLVLVFSGAPLKEGAEGQDQPRGGRATSAAKLEAARQRGALGLLLADPAGSESGQSGTPEIFMRAFRRPSLGLPRDVTVTPQITISGGLRDKILDAEPRSGDEVCPTALEGVKVRFRYSAVRERKQDRNVIGLFPGTDAEKSKEVIVYSAHYDHVGVSDTGEIYNGSDDNASGTSALLEIMEAFGEGPRPARSVAFLWVSGEEKGLLGSAWFADHNSLPQDHRIVANINLDMVSRNDGKKVGVTPSREHPDYNTLVPAAIDAGRKEELEVHLDIDQYYGRTDSYNFAKKGIPAMFFFSGVHDDYHKPTDDIEKADFDKAARIARAAYRLGWNVAVAEQVPVKIPAEAREVADSASSSAAGSAGSR